MYANDKKRAHWFPELDVLNASERRVDGRWTLQHHTHIHIYTHTCKLRAGILSIYEKNPICVTRDVMLCVDKEREKERAKEKERKRVDGGVRG